MYRKNRLIQQVFIYIALAWAHPSISLPSDWDQEMVIQSDRAELDRKTGMVIYEGKVELTQGSLKIQSERLLVIMDNNQLKQAVAEGKPASYQQQVSAGKPLTHAKAQRIDYYADSRELAFTGSAELKQGNNLFSGETIRYQLDNERVTASGSEPANPDSPQSTQPTERVRVVIQPNTSSDSEKPQQESPSESAIKTSDQGE